MSFRRFIWFMVGIVSTMLAGLLLGAKVAGASINSMTCDEYLAVERNERMDQMAVALRDAFANPSYIAEQVACLVDRGRLTRMEQNIERMCRGRGGYLVRNAWRNALEAHKSACNVR